MLISNKVHCFDQEMHPHERKRLAVALELLQTISQAVYWDNAINKVLGLSISVLNKDLPLFV
jgi:hypothetical protein